MKVLGLGLPCSTRVGAVGGGLAGAAGAGRAGGEVWRFGGGRRAGLLVYFY